MARSDTPEKPQRRWSKDNGRTWSDYEALPEVVTHPEGVRVVWTLGPQLYDAQREAIVSVWLRQTRLRGVYHNQLFSRRSSDMARTWSQPRQRATITLIDDRREGDSERLQLSNFSLLENREDHSIEVYLTRLGEDPDDFWGAHAYKYTLRLR